MYDFWITKYFKKQLKKELKKDEYLLEELKKSLKNFVAKGAISIASNMYLRKVRQRINHSRRTGSTFGNG